MQMRDMNSVLLSKPDEHLAINDDDDAKVFLMQFGLLAQFKTNLEESRMQIVTYPYHKTHFIVAILFTGKQKASDNGYLVHCLPKSKLSQAQIEDFMRQLGISQTDVQEIRPILKDDSTQN